MVPKGKERLILILAAILMAAFPSSAQFNSGQTDSLVRLLSAKYLEQVEIGGEMHRKAVSPTFLHNGTYLICDTALWNVERKVINCFGNVQMTQGESILTSDKLDYLIDDNLATFRGSVVQLRNKQDNILRTRKLDYNTRDSLAVFFDGASMKSEEGQIIESDRGTYSNAQSLFTFRDNVNMFTDSVFVKTTALDYDSKADKAHFKSYIDFWKDDNMLSAFNGWYDRMKETFFFNDRVHGLSRDQEIWCDSLYFYRVPNDVLMLGNAHVQDTSRSVAAISEYMFYQDSLSRVTMRNRAGVALWAEQQGKVDTTYMSSDLMVYETRKRCDIPESEVRSAAKRLEDILTDAVAEFRQRAAKQAADNAAKAREDDPNFAFQGKGGAKKPAAAKTAAASPAKPSPAVSDTTSVADTLAQADTLVIPDTSKVGFLKAIGDIRIFKSDMQARCDSLVYNDLDSIARFFKQPVIWNEANRQYSSDSLFVLVRDGGLDRANLMSNAFVITQEDSVYFDQIRSTDIMAFFDKEGGLKRFDALGGVDALFYLEENEALATVNKVGARMLSATMKDGDLDRVYYFENPKNDAYPIVQLPAAEHRMKGFSWQKERAPKSREDVTELDVLPSERSDYQSRPRASFVQTDIYFPGYMKKLYAGLDSVKVARRTRQTDQPAVQDTTAHDAPVQADTLQIPQVIPHADSLVQKDSLRVSADTASVRKPAAGEEDYMSPSELRRALRIAKRDARWSELDARDARKAALKKEKAEARRLKREEMLARRREKQEAVDQRKLEKYIERYQKQKERNERKQKPDPSGERSSGAEGGGELLSAAESGQQAS